MPIDTKDFGHSTEASSRKRKINIDGDVAWASGSGLATEDSDDLKSILRGWDPVSLVEALCNFLDEGPPETIQKRKAALIPLVHPDHVPKHCVRCHQFYREVKNTRRSCAIKCAKPEKTAFRNEEYDAVRERCVWQFPCCGSLVGYDKHKGDEYERDSDDSEGPGGDREYLHYNTCFTAKHTTDPTSVRYYKFSNEKKKEEGIDYSGRNKNVRTCEAKGCEREKLKRKL
ncbi:hypothetical protein FRC09_003557 [Ceratobasidium sp. 395]|nr:hypothetical protein FRC09_003557 [Ceratobasidium sp. 395]